MQRSACPKSEQLFCIRYHPKEFLMYYAEKHVILLIYSTDLIIYYNIFNIRKGKVNEQRRAYENTA